MKLILPYIEIARLRDFCSFFKVMFQLQLNHCAGVIISGMTKSSVEGVKGAKISKTRKSSTVLKQTKAPLKRKSVNTAHVKNTNTLER